MANKQYNEHFVVSVQNGQELAKISRVFANTIKFSDKNKSVISNFLLD